MLRTGAEGYKVLQLNAQSWPALEAFYRMTLGNARALSLDDRIGSIEAGKEADLIALDPRATPALTAQNISVPQSTVAAQNASVQGGGGAREALSYTVPAISAEVPAALSRGRLTNYVFAHSKYSSGLGQRGVLADLLIDDDELQPLPIQGVAQPTLTPDVRVAP